MFRTTWGSLDAIRGQMVGEVGFPPEVDGENTARGFAGRAVEAGADGFRIRGSSVHRETLLGPDRSKGGQTSFAFWISCNMCKTAVQEDMPALC